MTKKNNKETEWQEIQEMFAEEAKAEELEEQNKVKKYAE